MKSHAPMARKVPVTRTFHGDSYVDNYEWFRDATNPELLAHLEAENAWTQERTAHLEGLREQITAEISSRTRQTDISIAHREGNWWYYQRTWEGRQYPVLYRLPDRDGSRPDVNALGGEKDGPSGEQVVWDGNELAEGSEFFALSDFAPAPDGKLGAMGVDFTGDEHFALRIFDIETGHIVDDAVSGLGYGLAWTTDGSHVVYSRVDDAWRTWQIWLHEVGSPAEKDRLLYQEDDERFDVIHAASRDGQWIVVQSVSRTTSEVRLFSAAHPLAAPLVVCHRRDGLEYSVEPAGDHLIIVHNANRPDFEVATAPLVTSTPDEWIARLAPQSGERINEVQAFRDFAVVAMRSAGRTQLRVLPRQPEEAHPRTAQRGGRFLEPHEREVWGEPVIISSEEMATIALEPAPYWASTDVVYTVESLLTPPTQVAYTVANGESTVLKTLDVPNYDRGAYTQQEVWVEVTDGARVPMTLAYRSDVTPDGTNPGYMYGYGSYEVSNDPYFRPALISLLQRGVVVAWTHVRGGGEMGRAWYDNGKLLHKRNTFTDFVDCAAWLEQNGWAAPGRLAAEGGSAGGLLMGAVANIAPERFRAILAGVPFVDALTTILMPEMPLTVGEWEEWGNPIESAEVYQYMKSYSPVENVKHCEYPAILATTSLNDIRVSYVEPTKWVQVLRATTTNDEIERPILEKIEMVAGHAGTSGRYNRWQNRAFELAWLLDQIGAA
ncbi:MULTISPECIES: S9 family peptidase [unclassified Actinobaculum]|uniref:S9 family peptidase n=1 Tax=unclassified Actinobaculum TaxID=2609299 RepID=UPI000D527064|nr:MULTISPECIES: S9 family peptidase [unclassified Actinobaculum]AWE41460.1 S9 family peptidase [Actinobaculum sp. 313]RTE48169.1 S9 family peptidase [Actinobaculum sp. 352]